MKTTQHNTDSTSPLLAPNVKVQLWREGVLEEDYESLKMDRRQEGRAERSTKAELAEGGANAKS